MKRKMKHTQGKWTVKEDYYICAEDGSFIAKTTGNMKRYQAEEEEKANACLIATAPDLLEACKFAKAHIKHGAQKQALPILRAAIAKAEGKQRDSIDIGNIK